MTHLCQQKKWIPPSGIHFFMECHTETWRLLFIAASDQKVPDGKYHPVIFPWYESTSGFMAYPTIILYRRYLVRSV